MINSTGLSVFVKYVLRSHNVALDHTSLLTYKIGARLTLGSATTVNNFSQAHEGMQLPTYILGGSREEVLHHGFFVV